MKLIVAYIQPEQLNDVKKALYEKKIYKISVTNALGCGKRATPRPIAGPTSK